MKRFQTDHTQKSCKSNKACVKSTCISVGGGGQFRAL